MKALKVYQFMSISLVQITDGRLPITLEADAASWKHRQTISDTPPEISAVSTVAPSKILNQIAANGYSAIEKSEIQAAWQARWVKAA